MNKYLMVTIAVSLLTFPTAAIAQLKQVQKEMLFVGEDINGVKVYIHPESLKKQFPFARFWVYAVLPDSSQRRVASLDTYMAIDCVSKYVRILEIIRYDRNGDVSSTTSLGFDDPPNSQEVLGDFGDKMFDVACK
ncbi:surface-adhesin E family protein [Tumidithrix elongata RA019]|uniref:Surface-adhesin E family protein n=1 Tax=Tumidithrix elongata BACA0141 TaxID=2716417 RepID=A0AAW9PUE3_9CYAN|nr:surface-adhesin E family protein [Tumidithrix elongata RA019]